MYSVYGKDTPSSGRLQNTVLLTTAHGVLQLVHHMTGSIVLCMQRSEENCRDVLSAHGYFVEG